MTTNPFPDQKTNPNNKTNLKTNPNRIIDTRQFDRWK